MHSNTDTIPKYRPNSAIPIPIPARGGVWKRYATLNKIESTLIIESIDTLMIESILGYLDTLESILDTRIDFTTVVESFYGSN